MKKFLLILVVMICFAGLTGIATAATFTPIGPTPQQAAQATFIGGTGGAQTVQVVPSSNVKMLYDGATQAYSAASEHQSGNKIFGTGNSVPAVYFQIKTSNIGSWTITDGTTLGSSCVFDPGNWTAQ